MKHNETWLGTKEAAEKLGLTIRSLYRLIDTGAIPAYKFGRVIRMRDLDVEAYIDGARIEVGSIPHLYPDTKKKVEE